MVSCSIKQNINGIEQEIYLCNDCFSELSIQSLVYNINIYNDIINKLFMKELKLTAAMDSKKCSSCDSSIYDINETGKLGCSNCYTFFKDELIEIIYKIHGQTNHIGKAPTNYQLSLKDNTNENTLDIQENIDRLQSELKQAIEAEEYELAAELRDKINELRG